MIIKRADGTVADTGRDYRPVTGGGKFLRKAQQTRRAKQLLAQGKTLKQAGAELGCSQTTVFYMAHPERYRCGRPGKVYVTPKEVRP